MVKTVFSALLTMTATQWFHILGLIGALSVGVAFVTGLISIGLSWKIAREQEVKRAQLETELAKQRERAAHAEKSLLELRQRMEPRHASLEIFKKVLQDKPKAN